MTSRLPRYRLFGLIVQSDFALDALPRAAMSPDIHPADVRIVRGADVPAVDARDLVASGGSAVLTIPGLARYTITDGARILVEAVPDASARNLRLYLLGSAFGMLLHQRGSLPLHANAIGIGDHAVAFCGAPGAGKSTIAAWLHDRGHRILADDVCVVETIDGVPTAQAGVPRLRLWRDALETSGRDAADFERSFDDFDKYDVRTIDTQCDALPLAAVYRLGRDEATGIRRLSGSAAVEVLIANTYRGEYLGPMGGTQRHFAQCVALARFVPVFAADRAWGFDRFDAEATRLEAHAREMLSVRGE